MNPTNQTNQTTRATQPFQRTIKLAANTKILNLQHFQRSDIVFCAPFEVKLSDTKVTYKRIPVMVKNRNDITGELDGTIGDVVIQTPDLSSRGVSENRSMDAHKVLTGYSFVLELWGRAGPTAAEQLLVDVLSIFVEASKDHILEHKIKLGFRDLERSDMKSMSIISWSKEDGLIIEGLPPKWYPKCYTTGPAGAPEIISRFTDMDTEKPIAPTRMIGTSCIASAAIKIDSLFCNTRTKSIQTKQIEADVRIENSMQRRLLPRRAAAASVAQAKATLLDDDVQMSPPSDEMLHKGSNGDSNGVFGDTMTDRLIRNWAAPTEEELAADEADEVAIGE